MKGTLLIPSLLGLISVAAAQGGTSASYTLAPDTLDHGGLRGISASYTADFSASPGGAGSSAAYALRGGYAGQLAETLGASLDIAASPATLNEAGGTRQLSVTLIHDDLTTTPLAPGSVTWSVLSGPLSGISTGGLVTAANVYQDTPAVVRGAFQTFAGTLTLTVLNMQPDNFGSYAGDGLDDDWQVLHFGLDNPDAAPPADPDKDGQDNRFEFIAGGSPEDGSSFFHLRITPVPGQPGQKALVLSPRLPDRTYTVTTSGSLGPAAVFSNLTTTSISDNGQVRTITDTSATDVRKFYKLQISKP